MASSPLVILHDSQPYSNTALTLDLNILILVLLLRMLLFQTPDSLPNTALALQSLEVMSSSALPAVTNFGPQVDKSVYILKLFIYYYFLLACSINLMTFVLVMLIFKPVPLLALLKVSVYPKIDYFCKILVIDIPKCISLSSFNYKKFCEKSFLLDKVINKKRFYE